MGLLKNLDWIERKTSSEVEERKEDYFFLPRKELGTMGRMCWMAGASVGEIDTD